MKKQLLTLALLLFSGVMAFGQNKEVVTFKFVPGEDMFYIPWGGNDAELNRLYSLVDQYRAEIVSGRMPVYVDSYSASMRDSRRNRELAFIRANRVKSELITHKGLVEDNFITKNYTTAYEGNKDMVVVTLHIPVKEQPKPESKPEIKPVSEPEPTLKPEPEQESVSDKLAGALVNPALRLPHWPYCFAVRTNLLYDAFLLPTLGVEWRVNESLGIKLDGSYSFWGGEHGKVQKIRMLSPEVRWYMGESKRFYLGVGGNYAEYNIYGYLIGGILSDNVGYQGTLWSAGVTVGYQLYLSRGFSLDFNLGLGYVKSGYDSFNMADGVRVYDRKSQSKSTFGPTQAGVSLVWKIGGDRTRP